MINYIWAALIIAGTLFGIATGNFKAIESAAIDGAKESALLCISLVGVYALWLGLLNIAKQAGLIYALARKMRRIVKLLFSDIQPDGEACGYITLNIVANMLGMGNAATPFGLKAMKALQALNADKNRATDAMCMLLIVNASSVQLLPLTVIALRSASGSLAPAEIVLTTLIATSVTTTVGILAAKAFKRMGK